MKFDDMPQSVGSVGVLLENTPIVCGGFDDIIDYKHSLVVGLPKSILKLENLIKKRSCAASVLIDDSTLWITGGYCGTGDLTNIEV